MLLGVRRDGGLGVQLFLLSLDMPGSLSISIDGEAPGIDIHSLLLPETDSVPLPVVESSLSALKWFHMQDYFNPVIS